MNDGKMIPHSGLARACCFYFSFLLLLSWLTVPIWRKCICKGGDLAVTEAPSQEVRLDAFTRKKHKLITNGIEIRLVLPNKGSTCEDAHVSISSLFSALYPSPSPFIV